MAQCSEDELYQRADNLVRHAGQHFQSLFLQRWEGLTQSKWNGKKSVQLLVDMLSVHLSRLLLPHQKSQLVQGVVEEWDITLLSRLLIHFNKEENEEADEAIRSITEVRNKLAHNAKKKLNFEEYRSIERLVKSNLIILGMEGKAVQKIISKAEATSLNSVLEQLKKFQAEGDDLVNKKSYEKAIQVYSDAMLLPNLPPGYLSTLYEKRGFCHLSKSKKSVHVKNAQLDLAFSDGEKAVELNIDSWNGHHLLALILQGRGKLDEALVHYRRAIAISPGQSELKGDMDACTMLAGKMARQEHLDWRQLPMNLSERVEQFNNETNFTITEDRILKMGKGKHDSKLFPGREQVITGYKHLEGWGVPQNYSEAAKHFAKARQVGSTEGTYILAILHKEGLGVKQDIPHAVELLLEAAEKPVQADKSFPNLRNVGVLAAQHSLGLIYEEGAGVPKDFVKAAYWYKKAADSGYGNSANNLALLYSRGDGVPLNEKMAELYWKIGVNDRVMNSAYSLFNYYASKMEPELAKSYFNTAVDLGHERLKTSKAHVFEMISNIEKRRAEYEGDVKAFEKANNLSTRGLTFSERMKREASSRSPEMAALVDALDKLRVAEDSRPGRIGRVSTEQAEDIDITELVWKAQEGSTTADKILKCLANNARFIDKWEQAQPRTPVEIEELLDILYLCSTTASHHFKLPLEIHSEVLQRLNQLFKTFGGKKSKIDMKVRLCLFHVHCSVGGIDEMQTEILVEAVRRYPDEIPLSIALSCAFAILNEYRRGLEVAINGLLKAPNDPDLLRCKAGHLRLLDEEGRNGKKVREAYKRYIENAAVDDRMLPEAYYCIALSYIMEMKTKSKEIDEMICHYYGLGEEAEKVQLSCYLPYECNPKLVVKTFVMAIKHQKNPIGGLSESSAKGGRANRSGIGATGSSSEEKMYLRDPKRIAIILKHRGMAENMRKRLSVSGNEVKFAAALTVTPKLVHKIPKSLTELKAIVLQEMNPTKDHIYEGRILNVTVIEGPFFGLASLPLIVEDDNGEAIILCIYDVEHNAQAKRTFGVGAKFSVINPYLRIALDQSIAIRVDDPKCLIHNEGVEDMCRYCGKEGAKSTCSKCKKAKYCGRECQEMDWKILKHKMICFGGK